MNPKTAFQQMLLTESKRHPIHPEDIEEESEAGPSQSLCKPEETLVMSLSRVGAPTQRIISGTLAELAELPEEEFGGPLHSCVVVGKRLHPLELEYAGQFCVGGEDGAWWKVGKEVYGVVREGGR